MTKLKLIYDCRWIRVDAISDGISRYTRELGAALVDRDDLDITWLVFDARQLDGLPERPHIIANDPTDILREFRIARLLNEHRPDVVYSPFFLMGSRGRNYRLILTIHDMIFYHYRTPPQWLPQYIRIAWWLFHTAKWPMRRLLDTADVIATVSDTARLELEEWHMTRRPIAAVKNAVSGEFTPSYAPHWESRDVIYMGAFTPYKNVELLLRATALVPDIRLHLLSKMPASRRAELSQLMSELGISRRVVIHDGTPEDEFHALLAQGRCLITASRIEGFGLPLIEGQAAGVPVACSDTPIFREVGEDSVLYFDPDSAEQCAEAIRSLADKTTSQDLTDRGLANVTRFTWEISAHVAATICHEAVAQDTDKS